MLNLKKKLKKFLPFLLSCIILVSSFTFVSFAKQTSSNTFVMSCGTPSTGSGTGYLEILLFDGTNYYVRTFMWNVSLMQNNPQEPYYYFTDVSMDIRISKDKTDDKYTNVVFSLFTTGTGLGVNNYLRGNIYSFLSDDGDMRTFSVTEYGDTTSKDFTYPTSLQIVGVHAYGNCDVTIDISGATKEFYVLYAEDGAIYNAIRNGQQDQTDQIKENQDKNTDKIINGGHDSPQYSGSDESAVNDYQQAEKSVMDKISGGLDDAADLFSGFTGIISPGAFTGLSVVSTYMEKFMRIPHIGLLVRVALTLGLFSFIIGSAMIMVRWGGSNNRRFDSGRRRTGRSKGT